jgi:hypothetical protein
MNCEEKERLLAAYQTATEAFAASVTDLQRTMGTSSLTEYQRLQRVADDARLKSERARLALESHSASHGC